MKYDPYRSGKSIKIDKNNLEHWIDTDRCRVDPYRSGSIRGDPYRSESIWIDQCHQVYFNHFNQNNYEPIKMIIMIILIKENSSIGMP